MASQERTFRAMLAPLQRRVAMMAARAVVRLVKDDQARQRLQVEILKGELRDDVERMQDYGFTSHPKPGADAAVLSVAGARSQAIAIVVDDRRYRLLLEEGEVAIYDDLGNSVKLLRDRVQVNGVQKIEMIAPDVTVTADHATVGASSITINSDVTVNGDTAFNGTVTANGHRIDDTHKHLNSGGTGLGGVPQ